MANNQVTVTANKLDPVTQKYVPNTPSSTNISTPANTGVPTAEQNLATYLAGTKTSNMNSSNIGSATPIPIASPYVPPETYTTPASKALADAENTKNTYQTLVDDINKRGKDASLDIANMQTLLGGKSTETQQVYNEQGVTKAFNDLTDINAEATGLKNEAQAIPIQVEKDFTGTGATVAGAQPITTARLRDNALKALSLGQRAAIASAQYDKAKNYADMIIDAKYSQIEANIKAKQTNLEALKDFELTPAQEKQRQAQLDYTTKQAQDVADKKELEKNINNVLIELQKNGAPSSVITSVQNSGSMGDAIKNAGTYLASPETEVVKLGDSAAYLIDKRTGKVIRSFGGGGTGGSGVSGLSGTGVGNVDLSKFNSVINFATNAESSVAGKNMVANQMKGYIQNGDYKSAYNQVAQSVENSLTGATKERFANARTDYEVMQGLRNMIKQYKDAGGDMGLLKGTGESIERKLGQVSDPKLATIAVSLQREFQTYRNVMTGAAFSPAESAEYASVNPTTNKNLNLNLAVIDGALGQLKNRVDSTINARVPEAKNLIEAVNNTTTSTGNIPKGNLTDRDYVEKVLSTKGLEYKTVVNYVIDQANASGMQQPMPVIDNATGLYGAVPYSEYVADKSKYTPL